MTADDFVKTIIRAYRNAREVYEDNIVKGDITKVFRGRSHSISGVSEDLFANYLVSNDTAITAVYVDQPISVPTYKSDKGRTVTICLIMQLLKTIKL